MPRRLTAYQSYCRNVYRERNTKRTLNGTVITPAIAADMKRIQDEVQARIDQDTEKLVELLIEVNPQDSYREFAKFLRKQHGLGRAETDRAINHFKDWKYSQKG